MIAPPTDHTSVQKRKLIMAVMDEDWQGCCELLVELMRGPPPPTIADLVAGRLNPPDPVPPDIELAPPPPAAPRCPACNDTGSLKARDPMEPKGYRMLDCPCAAVPLKAKAQTACPSRGAGHLWLIADTFNDRCQACKLTRPRPKDKAASGITFGDPSDL